MSRPSRLFPKRAITRLTAGLAAIAAAWALGHGVQAVLGFPASIAGLVILASALTVWPSALDVVGPTADIAIGLLPVLFVPLAIGGAAALADVDVVALAVAVAVSVPVGFVVAALVSR